MRERARGPAAATSWQNVVQTASYEMKGVPGWAQRAGTGSWQPNDPGRRAAARVDRLIERLEDELPFATPGDLARSDAGQVMTSVAGSAGTRKQVGAKERVRDDTSFRGVCS